MDMGKFIQALVLTGAFASLKVEECQRQGLKFVSRLYPIHTLNMNPTF